MKPLSLFISLLALVWAQAHAQTNPKPKVKLISSVKTAEAGKPFKAVIVIKNPKGWWSYYNNSALSGLMATPVKFNTPEGVTISKPTFSTPTAVWKMDNYNYIFKETSYISYDVTVEPGYKGSSLDLSIEAGIQICNKNQCTRPFFFPASAKIALDTKEEAFSGFDAEKINAKLTKAHTSLTATVSTDGKSTTFTFDAKDIDFKPDQLHLMDRDSFLSAAVKQSFKADENGVVSVSITNNDRDIPEHFSGILYANDGSLGAGIQLEEPISKTGAAAQPAR